MKQRTEQLSQQWLKERAGKSGQKEQDTAGTSRASPDAPAGPKGDDSDSDVVIEDVVTVDTRKPAAATRASGRKGTESALGAGKKSGKANRLR